MLFKSKAETLAQIKNKKFKEIIIPNLLTIQIKELLYNQDETIKFIKKKFKTKIAVRSSSIDEDSENSSKAGEFDSYLNINPSNEKQLKLALYNVYKSYKNKSIDQNILIQEMVPNVKLSGVALTCYISNYCKSYIVCNYSIGKDTSIVTSGEKKTKNFYFFKNSSLDKIPQVPKIIIQKVLFLSKKLNEELIDIEFALDKKNNFYLLQLRPVVINKNKKMREVDKKLLIKLEKKISKLQKPHPNLIGRTTFFGVMPDWNPAEMIGIKPKNLAKSLYKELITDKVWAKQRTNYGFKDVMNNQLMSSFLGTPFIDIRTDFNSWIPKNLSQKISNKLIKYYLDKIKFSREFHDNVEFEILFTCFNFNSEKIKKSLNIKKFNNKEIYEILKSLKEITIESINMYDQEILKINKLKQKQSIIEKSKMYEFDKIYWHIEYCKELGTLPFAGLARIAFIAYDILNSLNEMNYITHNQKKIFLQNLKTISNQIDEDFHNSSKNNFIKKHGHVRPNTYEITSLNYREGYNFYYGSTKKIKIKKRKNSKFSLSTPAKKNIEKYLFKNGIKLSVDSLFLFIKKAIEAREYSKYVFTKSIDLIFNNILKLGNRLNIKREDLSFLEINDFLKLYYDLGSGDLEEQFKSIIKKNKIEYKINNSVKLPNIIISSNDIYFHSENLIQGNFFGSKFISGEIIHINENYIDRKINFLEGKIVCIYNADPGFDFIFSKRILGLVTCYGGSNSHMGIRCSEKNITSIIGIGDQNFKKVINSKQILIDPNAKKFSLI